MTSRIMSPADLEILTGCATPKAQRHWFTKNGIGTVSRDDGSVVLLKSTWNELSKSRSFKNFMPTTEEALKPCAIDIREPAVYFLMKGWDVVYVGKSKNLLSRLGAHVKSEMDWDTALHLHADEADIGVIEMEFIARLKPKYNVAGMPKEVTE